jgi:hypothetical protein
MTTRRPDMKRRRPINLVAKVVVLPFTRRSTPRIIINRPVTASKSPIYEQAILLKPWSSHTGNIIIGVRAMRMPSRSKAHGTNLANTFIPFI